MNIHNLEVGSIVSGHYASIPFWGTVIAVRHHPKRHFCNHLTIMSDVPFRIPGSRVDRRAIFLAVTPDGVECPGFQIDGAFLHGAYLMADRFEVLENSPAFAAKLYTEMLNQSLDRADATRARLGYIPFEQFEFEYTYRAACITLIDHYLSLIP